MSTFISLVKKDFLMEWRQKHTLFGVLLYVGATVFVVYMMMGQPEARTWNALFWITQLFVSVNSVAKSFLQEHPNRFRYYYTLADPATFFAGKDVLQYFHHVCDEPYQPVSVFRDAGVAADAKRVVHRYYPYG